ncbi:MAG: ABC transporter ATP-binding protein [Lachnospiraceae bacterium]|nr:ABC transporter ATP-binding protein [Lachnospiraceae bacterium]
MIKKLRYILTRKEKIKLVFLLFMLIIGSFLELLGVGVFVPFIEIIMDPAAILENEILKWLYMFFHEPSIEVFLTYVSLGICGIYIIKNIYLGIMQNCILKFSYNIRMNIAVKLLKTYMSESYTFHLSKNIAELQRCLTNDTGQFMTFINSSLQLLAEAAVCIAIGLYLFDTSHSITVAVVGILIVCVGAFSIVSKKVSTKLGLQNQMYNAKLFQWINQSLGGIKEIKVLHREKYFIDVYQDNYKKLIKGAKNNELLATIPKYIVEAMAITGLLLAVIVKMFFGRREIAGFIPQLSAFAVAAFRLLPSVGKINSYVNSIMYSVPSVDLIYKDLKEIENCRCVEIEETSGKTYLNFEDKINVRDLTYFYPNTENPVLQKVSLEIKKGETIALVGASGAGKTTLADIMLGVLEPQIGDVTIDGVSIYENMENWHSQLGYIPQTIYLSDDTIKNNVAFGVAAEKIDENAVKEALRKAQLLEFIETLDDGMDTFVGDRGIRLSGGQRQRIGIARALYHDPEILVLDEATSALDQETENAVMESIENLKGSKTMIIIAHRLTTIRNADKVYEVKNAEVIERNKEDIIS